MSADEIQSIRDALHRIEIAIVGDPAHGHRGLVARMDAVEKTQSEHGKRFILWGGIATGLSIAVTQLKIRLFG